MLVLDKNGKLLNVVDKFSSLSNLPIDKNTIDVISKEVLRTILIKRKIIA